MAAGPTLVGSHAYWGIQKQANKGTFGTTSPTIVVPFTGGSLNPERVVERLQETDNNRDPGSAYLSRGGAAGTPETYLRESSFPIFAYAALGNLVTSLVSGANYSHVATTAGTLPYFTLYKMVGGTVYERYRDMQCNSLTIRGEAGGALSIAASWLGTTSDIQTAAYTLPGSPHNMDPTTPQLFHNSTLSLGGVVQTGIRSFELTIENNVQQLQANSINLFDVVAGRRELSFSADIIFDTTDAYNRYRTWLTGSTGGTTPSSTLLTEALDFTFASGADNSVQLELPKAAYEEFPVDPDAGGEAVVSSVRGAGVRPTSGAFTTWTTKNQVANAAGATYGDS